MMSTLTMTKLLMNKIAIKKQNNIVQNIIDATPTEDIENEINTLKQTENKKLFSHGDYDVFFTKSEEIPSIMREIGRQRELTFRAIEKVQIFLLIWMSTIIITTIFSFGTMQIKNWLALTEWLWAPK